MGDSEERNGGNLNKGRLVFTIFSLILVFGVGFYVSAYGTSLPGFFKDATAIVSQTLRNVLDSGSNKEKAFEVDLSFSPVRSDGAGGKLKETKETAPAQSSSGASNKNETVAATKNKKVSKGAENSGETKLSGAPASSSPSTALAATTSKSISKENAVGAPDCNFLSAANPNHKIVFNEIAWMGSPQITGETSVTASNNEWMELKNLSQASVDLVGWQILDESEKFNVIFDGGKVSANGLYLLERSDDDSVPGIPADKIYNGALSNSGMWLKLLDKECALVDEINATSGWPGGDNSAKKTLERNSGGGGWSFDAAPVSTVASAGRQSWHTSEDAGGTPKKENSMPVAVVAAGDPNAKYSLGVSLNGDGSGAVYSSPAGISCGVDCTEEYLRGAQLVLTASSSPNSSFLGWSGACSGTSNCKLTVTSTLSVTASFKSLAPALSLSNGSQTGSSAPPPPALPTATTTGTGHLAIAEVQVSGASTSNDFIKIYNPTASSVDVSGWKLRKRTQTENVGDYYSIKVFPSGSSVAAQGYFVWANSGSGFSESIGADTSSTETLAANNSIALLDANGVIVDALTWGSGHVSPYVEGSAYPTNPTANQVLKRRFFGGAIQDTDNNSSDFTIE